MHVRWTTQPHIIQWVVAIAMGTVYTLCFLQKPTLTTTQPGGVFIGAPWRSQRDNNQSAVSVPDFVFMVCLFYLLRSTKEH